MLKGRRIREVEEHCSRQLNRISTEVESRPGMMRKSQDKARLDRKEIKILRNIGQKTVLRSYSSNIISLIT